MPPCASSSRPLRSVDGAGERALAMAEQLALEQIVSGSAPQLTGTNWPCAAAPL